MAKQFSLLPSRHQPQLGRQPSVLLSTKRLFFPESREAMLLKTDGGEYTDPFHGFQINGGERDGGNFS